MPSFRLLKMYPGCVGGVGGTVTVNGWQADAYRKYPEFWKEIFYVKVSDTSIKRISDGEIFSVGDKICGTLAEVEKLNGYVVIESFDFAEDLISLDNGGFLRMDGRDWGLKGIKKYVGIPLGKTEDGVDIYEGDVVYLVGSKGGYAFTAPSPCSFGSSRTIPPNSNCLYYSHKEVAQEYCNRNAKRFSINEVLNLLEYYPYTINRKLVTEILLDSLS